MRRSIAALALVLLPLVVTGVAAPRASADVGPPTWWNGDCDANHWNAAAATMGWTGVGAHRLGAAYLGIPVCGPRRSGEGAPDVQWLRQGWGHFEWECTELAFRFMAQIYGVNAYGANGSGVVRNYLPSYGGGLQTIANGTPGTAPVPGDVISFDSGPSPAGHVAVVAGSSVNSSGIGTILLLSQNDTTDGWRTLTVNNWTVAGFGTEVPYGWLHDPFGRGGPGVTAVPSAGFVRLGDGPAAAGSADGSLDVFVRGADDGLWTRHDGGTWTDWTSLGGVIRSQPAAVSTQPGTLDVYVLGADNAIWARHFANGTWGPWWTLGGYVSNAPTAVSSGGGVIDVFGVGSDAAVWTRRFANGGWGPWTTMGGAVTSAPSAASSAAGTIDVFDRGTDGALWTRHFIGGVWGSWASMGGALTTGPSASSAGTGSLDVFVRGTDGAVWTRHFASGTWSGWMSAGGLITSPPASASTPPDSVDLFARGVDDALWTRRASGGVWGTWTSLGGIVR
jgi:hypothetical protein